MSPFYGGWAPYVSAAEKRQRAKREMDRLRKKGRVLAPVVIEGRLIARTFWGKAWCDNLERYSDYASRLPRGRAYARNGSVLDLQIAAGEITALVSGTEIYEVRVGIEAVAAPRWKAVCTDCAGAIDSLVELLQGKLSDRVMERICRVKTGLFPAPAEIELSCSCPDSATMCKHVAAVLYGVGARLDAQPELLFALRKVDHGALIARAGRDVPLSKRAPVKSRLLDADDLSAMFGLEIATPAVKPGRVKVKRAVKVARAAAPAVGPRRRR